MPCMASWPLGCTTSRRPPNRNFPNVHAGRPAQPGYMAPACAGGVNAGCQAGCCCAGQYAGGAAACGPVGTPCWGAQAACDGGWAGACCTGGAGTEKGEAVAARGESLGVRLTGGGAAAVAAASGQAAPPSSAPVSTAMGGGAAASSAGMASGAYSVYAGSGKGCWLAGSSLASPSCCPPESAAVLTSSATEATPACSAWAAHTSVAMRSYCCHACVPSSQ